MGFRLAYVEHTARSSGSASAHAAHDEYPHSDKEDKGEDVPEEVAQGVVFLLVVELAVEGTFFFLFIKEAVERLDRPGFQKKHHGLSRLYG